MKYFDILKFVSDWPAFIKTKDRIDLPSAIHQQAWQHVRLGAAGTRGSSASPDDQTRGETQAEPNASPKKNGHALITQ